MIIGGRVLPVQFYEFFTVDILPRDDTCRVFLIMNMPVFFPDSSQLKCETCGSGGATIRLAREDGGTVNIDVA